MLESQLAPWVESTDGVVLRKIDIVDWDSAAAEQMNRDFDDVDSIPYTRVYDRSGNFLGAVGGADTEGVQALVRRGL